MKIQLRSESDFIQSRWTGGTTTQLFIYPQYAVFQDRNFDFRLSTALVETPQSNFTALPGFSRKIMIIDGEISLHHEQQYTKTLKPFESDSFDGAWQTKAIGQCTDFNVICRNGVSSYLEAFQCKAEHHIKLPLSSSFRWYFLYLCQGEGSIIFSDTFLSIRQHELLIIENPEESMLTFSAEQNLRVILTGISHF